MVFFSCYEERISRFFYKRRMIERDFWDGQLRAEKVDENKEELERVSDLGICEGGRCKLERREWRAKKLSDNKDVRFLGCYGVKSGSEIDILNIVLHLNFYFLILQKTHIRNIKFHFKKMMWNSMLRFVCFDAKYFPIFKCLIACKT